LKFREHLDTGGHTSHSQILQKGVINLKGKKILIRPSQAETTKGKNVIIGESREMVRPTTKTPKPTLDEPSAKYKKDNAHTKSRQNWIVRKVIPKLPVSPCQANVSVAGRCGDSRKLESFLNSKLCSQDRRERKLHTTMLFPPFRHPMPKPLGRSPMMFQPYSPWFHWYAPLMQDESFYPRSAKNEPNGFDSLAGPRKDHFYQKTPLKLASKGLMDLPLHLGNL
jgi:hypothetical protein